jgi:hypothetical protein
VDYLEDKDWFKVGGSQADKYSLLVIAPSENVKIAIYDASLNLLSTDRSYMLDLSASSYYYIEASYDENARYRKASYNIQIGKVTENTAGVVEIDTKAGKVYNVSINAKESTDIGAKVFIVTYDTNLLQLTSAAKQAPTPQTTAGKIPGTDITILSHSNGVLTLEVNRTALNAYTGMATVLSFEGVADGTAEIIME